MMRLPWWLSPWREVLEYRKTRLHDLEIIADYERRVDDLCETAKMDMRTIRQLDDANAKLASQVDSLRGQLAAKVTGARTSGAALSTADPEFILVGIPRPDGSKRLQASKDVSVSAFAMTEMDDPPPRWKIGAIMSNLLIIDKPSYGACMEHLFRIWANWAAEQRGLPVAQAPWSKAGADVKGDVQRTMHKAETEAAALPKGDNGDGQD